jgi:hypothetical protein
MECIAMLMYCWHAFKLGVYRAVAQPCVDHIRHNTKINSVLHRKIVALCCEKHIKHTNTLCRRSAEFYYVKVGGTCSNHSTLKDRVY